MSDLDDYNIDESDNPEQIELVRDSDEVRRNTVSTFGFLQNKNNNKNRTLNAHNEIARNLAQNSEEETDENNDADPEELIQRDPDEMNKTLDDIWTLQIFGKKDPNKKQIPFESKSANIFERMLHPMRLEAGALVLAIRCKQFGLVNFLIALILGGMCAYWTLVMMIKAGRTTKERDYSKVVKAILGNKVGVYVDCNITIYLLGAVISFQVIIYQILGSIIYDIMKIFDKIDKEKYPTFEVFKEDYWRKKLIIKFPVMLGVAALVFPLCLLRDVSKMRFASLIGVLALIYSIIVIIIESFFFLKNKNWDILSDMNWYNITKAFSIDDGIPFFGSCRSFPCL